MPNGRIFSNKFIGQGPDETSWADEMKWKEQGSDQGITIFVPRLAGDYIKRIQLKIVPDV